MAKTVYIRPISEPDLDLVVRLYEDPEEATQYGFFGYLDYRRLRRDFAETGFMTEDRGRLAVALEGSGEFVGEVSWHKVVTGPTSSSWNIGIGLLASARGYGYGTRAQRLLAEYLFAHTQLNRIEASTEVDNVAERRALEKAGFTYEGTLRGACFRAGHWRDMASYSMVRADLS